MTAPHEPTATVELQRDTGEIDTYDHVREVDQGDHVGEQGYGDDDLVIVFLQTVNGEYTVYDETYDSDRWTVRHVEVNDDELSTN